MIRVMMMSSSKYAILPMQDLLGLGSEGRMNVPSTCGQSNWSWQLHSLEIDSWRLNRLRGLIEIYGREGR
jgi:4-alpha-glucanotransferase